jgi:glycerol uptake facilitator-like aquaporin
MRLTDWSMQIGCASVSAEVVSKATHGVFQVAAVWGLVVILSISLFGRISGAHFNPAISVAMAIWRPGAFSARSQLAPYIISQIIGALVGATIAFAASYSSLLALEELDPTIARSTGEACTRADALPRISDPEPLPCAVCALVVCALP